MAQPPKYQVPGLNRGHGIPSGYIVGRLPGSGRGPAQLISVEQLSRFGVDSKKTPAGNADAQNLSATVSGVASLGSAITSLSGGVSTSASSNLSTAESYALSSVTSLSTGVSSSLSSNLSTGESYALSSVTSLSTGVSTSLSSVLSTAESYALSSVTSLSTGVSTSLSSNLSTAESYALSSVTSLSTGVSTSLSSNLSTAESYALSSVTSLSTVVSTSLSTVLSTAQNASSLTSGTLAAARLGGMSNISNSCGLTSLNNVSNYFDGPSVAQGTSGTWLVGGTIEVYDTAGAASINVKLWDGTTAIATTTVFSGGANFTSPVSLFGVMASPAGNLRLSAQDTTSVNGKIAAGGNIVAIRIG